MLRQKIWQLCKNHSFLQKTHLESKNPFFSETLQMSKFLLELVFTFIHFTMFEVQMSRSRAFSMSSKSWFGRVLNLAIKFTICIWEVMWCSWILMFMKGGILLLDTFLGTNAAGWPLYGPGWTSTGLGTTSRCFNGFCWFCWFAVISMSVMRFTVLFPAGTSHWAPISCLLQACLQPLYVQAWLEHQLSLFIIILLNNP